MTPTDLPPGTGSVLQIDLDAIAANWRDLCARHTSGPVAAVVKADAYGLGAGRVVPKLYAAGCRHIFVAHLDEALAIRALAPEAIVAVLDGPIPGSETIYAAQGIHPVLSSLDQVAAWSALAAQLDRKLPAFLHIDTGMNRLGLDARELATLQQDRARLAGIALDYIMTHFVASEVPEDPVNTIQCDGFARACAGLPAAKRSLANSSGIFLGPQGASDLARPGAALYGINPTPGQPNPMRTTIRLLAQVLQVRDIQAGARVGYNGVWAAARPSRIATAQIGYADGFHRALSNHGHAFFDGSPVPLVGRVSMDLTTFDVTDLPMVVPGAWLELIGPHQPPDAVAAEAGTNGYEILTSLGARFHRTVIGA